MTFIFNYASIYSEKISILDTEKTLKMEEKMRVRKLFIGGLILFSIGFLLGIISLSLEPIEYPLNNEVYLIHWGTILIIIALILLVYGMILIYRAAKLEKDFVSLFGSTPPSAKWQKGEMQKKIDRIARENKISIEWIRKTAEAFGYIVKG